MRWQVQNSFWQGVPWECALHLHVPNHARRTDVCVLEITGGPPNGVDLARAGLMASSIGVPVAVLFDIPNQPLWEMREDDLIAHTFRMRLETGDPSWPLLFPMVDAAHGAMDLLEHQGFESFVVTGASKRGWTAWLTGITAAQRTCGLAPRVFDNLDMMRQMPAQLEAWGTYSPKIDDYTRRELQETVSTEEGRQLVRDVDPYFGLSRVQCPVMLFHGSNDAYWTVDAARHYWDTIPGQPRVLTYPNEDHGVGDRAWDIPGLTGFLDGVTGGFELPSFDAGMDGQWRSSQPAQVQCWRAEGPNNWFADSTWTVVDQQSGTSGAFEYRPGSDPVAYLLVAQFERCLLGSIPCVIRPA